MRKNILFKSLRTINLLKIINIRNRLKVVKIFFKLKTGEINSILPDQTIISNFDLKYIF